MIKETINEKIQEAMKSGKTIETKVYRLVKSELLKLKTAKDAGSIDDAVEIKMINKMIAQREDSANEYLKANRPELANIEKSEIVVLKTLLPELPSEEDIEAKIIELKENGIEIAKKNTRAIITEVTKSIPLAESRIICKLIAKYE